MPNETAQSARSRRPSWIAGAGTLTAVPEPIPKKRRRRWLSRLLVGGLVVGVLHLVAWRAGLTKLTTPGDMLLNLGAARFDPALAVPPGTERHVVVVLHGLGRSAWSMWKTERLLEGHGYEVWNETYDGASAHLTELGQDLGARLDAHLRVTEDGRPVRLYAVGHSMGGLVLRSYLARPGAREFHAMVLLGTPNRGSALATQLRDTWYFSLFLGSKAARDLAPEEGVIAELGSAPPQLGNVIGATMDNAGRSSRIPGDDDGRIGVDEAHLAGETDAVLVNVSHTFMMIDDQVHHQLLHFLRHRSFAQ